MESIHVANNFTIGDSGKDVFKFGALHLQGQHNYLSRRQNTILIDRHSERNEESPSYSQMLHCVQHDVVLCGPPFQVCERLSI